jgi:hypothetical protein
MMINFFKSTKMNARILTSLVILLTASGLFSCALHGEKGNRDIVKTMHQTGSFDRLHVSGIFKVILIEGDSPLVEVETDSNLQEHIRIEVTDGLLTLSTNPHVSIDPSRLDVYITVNRLKELRTSGASSITSRHTLSADHLNIQISGASDLNLKVRASSMKTHVAGAANVKLNGDVREHEIRISGVASVNCSDLNTLQTDVSISGAGTAKVHAENEITASVSGVGSIQFSGDPASKKLSTSGAGSIKPI